MPKISSATRLSANKHLAAVDDLESQYLQAKAKVNPKLPPQELQQFQKLEQKALKQYQDGIKKIRRDMDHMLKQITLPDDLNGALLDKLQNAVSKHSSIAKHGNFDPNLHRQEVMAQLSELKAGTKPRDFKKYSIQKDNLEAQVFGKSFHNQLQDVLAKRDEVYTISKNLANLPDSDPSKGQEQEKLQQALSEYGRAKASMTLNDMEMAKRTPMQIKDQIDNRMKLLNSPIFDSDPVAKQLIKAECDNYPNVKVNNLASEVSRKLNYDQVSFKLSDEHYTNRDLFKSFLEQKLGTGYTVEAIPSYNNVLFKISDGDSTVVAKLGVFASKLTEMGCDYPTALRQMENKSHFSEVYNSTTKSNKNDTLSFEVGEFMPGQNMASFYRKQDVSTDMGIMRRQENALKDVNGIMEMLENLRDEGMTYTDLKCGNFIKDENGQYKIADMKSLLYRGDHPDTDFRTGDIPVTFVSDDCIREGANGKTYYDIDHVVKTALAVQMIEMLTLSDDAGTSPSIGFGKIKINWDQPILQSEIGKEIKGVYDKLIANDPTYTLDMAQRDIQAMQLKLNDKVNEEVKDATHGVTDQKGLDDMSRRSIDLSESLHLEQVTDESKEELSELVEKSELLQSEEIDDPELKKMLDDLDDFLKEIDEAFKEFDSKFKVDDVKEDKTMQQSIENPYRAKAQALKESKSESRVHMEEQKSPENDGSSSLKH